MADPKIGGLNSSVLEAATAARTRPEHADPDAVPVVGSADRYVRFDPEKHPFTPGMSGPAQYPEQDGPPQNTPYTVLPVAVPTNSLTVDTETGAVGLAPWMELVDSRKIYTMTPEEKTGWERAILPAGSQVKPNTSPASAAINQMTQMGAGLAGGLGNIKIAAPLLHISSTGGMSVAASAAGPLALIGGVWGAKQAVQLTTDALDMHGQIKAVQADYDKRVANFKADHPDEPVPESLLHPTIAMPARQPNGMNVHTRDTSGAAITVHQEVPLDVARKINRQQFVMAALTSARTGLMVGAGLTLNPFLAAASLGISVGTMLYMMGPQITQMVQQFKAAGVSGKDFLGLVKALPKLPQAVYRAIASSFKKKSPNDVEPDPVNLRPDKPFSVDPAALAPVMMQIPAGRQVVNPTLQYKMGMDLLAADLRLTLDTIMRNPRTYRGPDGPKALTELMAQHPGADLVYRFAKESGKKLDLNKLPLFCDTLGEMGQKVPGVPTAIVAALQQKQMAAMQAQMTNRVPPANGQSLSEQPT